MLNKVVLMGRLTADPEIKHTSNDIAVARFSIAVDRDYTKAGEEKQTDFINVVSWRSTAEFISKYFRKGQLIALTGTIRTGTYTAENGENRRIFEVVAEQAYFTGDRQSNGTGQNSATAEAYSRKNVPNIDADEDEDLPF